MWARAINRLKNLAKIAEDEGVTFMLENLNSSLDHPGVPFSSVDDTLALVASVDRPGVRMNLDLYHAQVDSGNLIEQTRRCLPFVCEIQVADVPGRFEPGTGEVNFENIAQALAEMGYSGPVGLESYAKYDGFTAIKSFQKAFSPRRALI
jgi:hydroxypyruvate isomerase